MNDFVSTPAQPASPEGSAVTAGEWWPAIDVNRFRARYNLGTGSIPHARIEEALVHGLDSITRQLGAWQLEAILLGFDALADVAPEDVLNDEPRLVHLFRRAVELTAAAELADNNLDLTATDEGTDDAEARRSLADRHRARATAAVRDIIGGTRCDVELV